MSVPKSDKAQQLADKLVSEGDKTLAYFHSLPEAAWSHQLFNEGSQWDVRGMFEHLCVSEHSLRRLFEQILATGQGVPENFDIHVFNQERTGRFTSLSQAELFTLYADTRAKTVAFVRELRDTDLSIRGRHPALGESALEDQIKMIYLHHQAHMRDVRRSLGT